MSQEEPPLKSHYQDKPVSHGEVQHMLVNPLRFDFLPGFHRCRFGGFDAGFDEPNRFLGAVVCAQPAANAALSESDDTGGFLIVGAVALVGPEWADLDALAACRAGGIIPLNYEIGFGKGARIVQPYETTENVAAAGAAVADELRFRLSIRRRMHQAGFLKLVQQYKRLLDGDLLARATLNHVDGHVVKAQAGFDGMGAGSLHAAGTPNQGNLPRGSNELGDLLEWQNRGCGFNVAIHADRLLDG